MKKGFCIILVLLLLTAVMPSAVANDTSVSFADVLATDWYAAVVSYAASTGYAIGGNGYFRPNAAVTRGEFITMLAHILCPEGIPDSIPDSGFTDVPQSEFYARPVAWGYAAGLVSGTSEDSFSPEDKIRREDMALIILRAEDLPALQDYPFVEAGRQFCDDDQISSYAREAIATLQRQGLLSGDTFGRVNPKQSLTRAEAAAVLSHIQMYVSGHTHSYSAAETVPPSCTASGLQYYRCGCGSFYGEYAAPALGHDYVLTQTDRETWTETYCCSRCCDSFSQSLPGQKPKQIYDGDSLLTNEEILSYIDRLQQMYPDLISSYVGGLSVWKAPIRVVSLGKGNRYIFMNGNIHGNETVTTNYLLKVLDTYAYAYATETTVGGYSIKPLLDCFTIVMIPCSNPDGRLLVLSGYDTKNNGNGVNLNRNFPTNWVYDSSGLYGPSAGSEPETQAILEVLGRYPFELVLDCHTSGNVIYYADYDCSSELRNRSYSIATALSQESGYRLYLYEASAGMANYARHPYGVPGLTIEMYPYTSGVIDCTRFSEWVWPKLDTMPAIAMSYLK